MVLKKVKKSNKIKKLTVCYRRDKRPEIEKLKQVLNNDN